MIIYQLAREYAPYAGAGGLKEVVTGLAKSFAKYGHSSSAFLPLYGFIDKSTLKKVNSFQIDLLKESLNVNVYLKIDSGVNLYFFEYPSLTNKKSVYTYTAEDESLNIDHRRGMGFVDNGKINIILQVAFLKYVTEFLEVPDVLSLHDGHTGLLPILIMGEKKYQDKFRNCRIFFTIHNAGSIYHQKISLKEVNEYVELNSEDISRAITGDHLDPLLVASLNSKIVTVSPYYADEILNLKHEKTSDHFGRFCRKNNIVIEGITNGINIDHYKTIGIDGLPQRKHKEYIKRDIVYLLKKSSGCRLWGMINNVMKNPLFLFQNRITEQKGILNLIKVFRDYKKRGGKGNLVVMGTGEAHLEEELKKLVKRCEGSVLYVQGYEEKLAMNLFVASDFFLLPSLWEPCGLTDFEAILSGSIPLVNKTGGLQKIVNNRSGFIFKGNRAFYKLLLKCDRLFAGDMEVISKMNQDGYRMVIENYTWDHVASNEYIPMFSRS